MRRPGAYELLFTDLADAFFPPAAQGGPTIDRDVPGRGITLRNGSFADPNFALQTLGNLEEPPDLLGAAAGHFTIDVAETGGFTTVIPLWDANLAEEYDHNASLRSLRGYLQPLHLSMSQNLDPGAFTGRVFRVRVELLPLEVSEEQIILGTPGSPTLPYISFSRSANRRRIWWRREWLMAANNEDIFNYWGSSTVPGTNETHYSNEPRLASFGGSSEVRLKKLMRIKRERWPFLALSVQGGWPAGATVNTAGTNLMTLNGTQGQEVVCTITMHGHLRAYVQK